ncbi:MAG: pacearchaeosortase [Candidatus Nanoarchaeia archaeon]|nr:pacearchaeosortase [Candidatus Nanoarchaeia archaeon]
MGYYRNLILRILILGVVFFIPLNLFYLIFLKPTLFLSGIFWISKGIEFGKDYLVYNDNMLSFIPACIATSAYYLLFALVMLVRKMKWIDRLKVMIVGFLFIFIGNVIRINILIYYFINNNVDMFQTIHFLMWNIVSTVYVILVWLFLVYRFKIHGIPLIDDIRFLWKRIKA